MNTVASLDQLANTASKLKGFSATQEKESRILFCEIIQASCILLQLPQIVAATAQVIIQRLLLVVSIGSMPTLHLVGAVIYLATKLEETPTKLRSIVSVIEYTLGHRNSMCWLKIDFTSTEYYEKRLGILDAETKILGKLGFEVHVEHPHSFM